MVEAHLKTRRSFMADLMAIIVNCHRSSKSKPVKSSDFYQEKKTTCTMDQMREMIAETDKSKRKR